jgi:tryptophan 2,3-dioxygenase
VTLTYSDYLKLDELLDLQLPRSEGPEHDELLFIIVHQVYELWFKQILHELDQLRRFLEDGETTRAQGTLARVLKIWKVLVAQLDVLETMTPLEFLSFRDRLESGSGLQSWQFRTLEFALGVKSRKAVERYPAGSEPRRILEERYRQPTVWDSFLAYLAGRGYEVPASAAERDVTQRIEPNPELQPLLIEVYRNDPAVGAVCERLVDLDEGVQEWRYHHVKMVERTIGLKRGTGGTAGAEYLRRTLFQAVFPDLWEIRTEL